MEGDTNRATVTIASGSGDETLTAHLDVDLIIKRAEIQLSTDTVSFSALVGSEGADSTLVFINNIGAGPPRALGEIREIDPQEIEYIDGESDWLEVALVPVERALDQVKVKASADSFVDDGLSVARLAVESEFGGEDSLTVTLAVRKPDSSLDEQTIQFVDLDNLAPYPGDSLVVDPAPSPTGTLKVGVRNGSPSLLDLVGLSVSEVNYIKGDSDWMSPAFERTTASFEDPAVLFIRLETRDLPSGEHVADFSVTSELFPLFETQPKGTFRVILRVR
jgi:hypothetical protein